MSKFIVEYIVSRYDVFSKEKEVIVSVFAEPNDYHTLEAVNRLQKIIRKKTKEAVVIANSYRIVELKRNNNSLNYTNKCVHFEKTIAIENCSYKDKIELDEELKKILKDKKGIFTTSIEPVYKNKFIYTFGSRLENYLTKKDKEIQIKRLISARKGAITRSKNKMIKIEESYKKTLFPDAYKTDKKYMSLQRNLKNQQNRFEDAKKMNIKDIDTIFGIKKFSIFMLDGLKQIA